MERNRGGVAGGRGEMEGRGWEEKREKKLWSGCKY